MRAYRVFALLACLTVSGLVLAEEPTPAPQVPAPAFLFPPAKNPPADASADLTQRIYADALDWLDRAQTVIPKLQPAAEMAAERFARGGMLYLAGNAGFGEEMFFRAGGYPFAKYWTKPPLKADDVLFVGQLRPDEPEFAFTLLKQLEVNKSTAGMLVIFNSQLWPQSRRLVNTLDENVWNGRLFAFDAGAPRGGSLEALALDQMSAAALAWMFQAEVFSAATRQGHTLACNCSDYEPGGKDWNAVVEHAHVHPTQKLAPIPAGKIATAYVAECRREIGEFLKTQHDAVREAAKRLAACLKSGHMVWLVSGGHIHTKGHFMPPELDGVKYVGREYQFPLVEKSVPAGDLVIWIGPPHYPKDEVESLRARGCDVVTVVPGESPFPADAHLLHIPACWPEYDAALTLEGYPVHAFPASGVVGTLQWYSILGETLKLMQSAK